MLSLYYAPSGSSVFPTGTAPYIGLDSLEPGKDAPAIEVRPGSSLKLDFNLPPDQPVFEETLVLLGFDVTEVPPGQDVFGGRGPALFPRELPTSSEKWEWDGERVLLHVELVFRRYQTPPKALVDAKAPSKAFLTKIVRHGLSSTERANVRAAPLQVPVELHWALLGKDDLQGRPYRPVLSLAYSQAFVDRLFRLETTNAAGPAGQPRPRPRFKRKLAFAMYTAPKSGPSLLLRGCPNPGAVNAVDRVGNPTVHVEQAVRVIKGDGGPHVSKAVSVADLVGYYIPVTKEGEAPRRWLWINHYPEGRGLVGWIGSNGEKGLRGKIQADAEVAGIPEQAHFVGAYSEAFGAFTLAWSDGPGRDAADPDPAQLNRAGKTGLLRVEATAPTLRLNLRLGDGAEELVTFHRIHARPRVQNSLRAWEAKVFGAYDRVLPPPQVWAATWDALRGDSKEMVELARDFNRTQTPFYQRIEQIIHLEKADKLLRRAMVKYRVDEAGHPSPGVHHEAQLRIQEFMRRERVETDPARIGSRFARMRIDAEGRFREEIDEAEIQRRKSLRTLHAVLMDYFKEAVEANYQIHHPETPAEEWNEQVEPNGDKQPYFSLEGFKAAGFVFPGAYTYDFEVWKSKSKSEANAGLALTGEVGGLSITRRSRHEGKQRLGGFVFAVASLGAGLEVGAKFSRKKPKAAIELDDLKKNLSKTETGGTGLPSFSVKSGHKLTRSDFHTAKVLVAAASGPSFSWLAVDTGKPGNAAIEVFVDKVDGQEIRLSGSAPSCYSETLVADVSVGGMFDKVKGVATHDDGAMIGFLEQLMPSFGLISLSMTFGLLLSVDESIDGILGAVLPTPAPEPTPAKVEFFQGDSSRPRGPSIFPELDQHVCVGLTTYQDAAGKLRIRCETSPGDKDDASGLLEGRAHTLEQYVEQVLRESARQPRIEIVGSKPFAEQHGALRPGDPDAAELVVLKFDDAQKVELQVDGTTTLQLHKGATERGR